MRIGSERGVTLKYKRLTRVIFRVGSVWNIVSAEKKINISE